MPYVSSPQPLVKMDELSVTITISILPILNLFEVVKRPHSPLPGGGDLSGSAGLPATSPHSQDPSQLLTVSWVSGDTSDHSYSTPRVLEAGSASMSPFYVRYLAQNRHSVSVCWRLITWGTHSELCFWEPSHMLSVFTSFQQALSLRNWVSGEVIWWWHVWVHTYTKSLVYTHTCSVKRQDGQDFQPRIQRLRFSRPAGVRSWECPLRLWTCLFLKEQLSLQELSWGALSSE